MIEIKHYFRLLFAVSCGVLILSYCGYLDNGRRLVSFYAESDDMIADGTKSVYLIYSGANNSCSAKRPPEAFILDVNSDTILVTEDNGCDAISKIKNAYELGYDAMILIREGHSPGDKEHRLRKKLKPDFPVYFVNIDNGDKIREFVIETQSSEESVRYTMRFQSDTGKNVLLVFDMINPKHFYSRIKKCQKYIIQNLDVILPCALLSALPCIVIYFMFKSISQYIFQFVQILRRKTPGVEIYLLLPKVTWQKSAEGLPVYCSICREDFKTDDQLVRLPCGHFDFHVRCIYRWLKAGVNRNCPKCRERVPESCLDPEEFPPQPQPVEIPNTNYELLPITDLNLLLFELLQQLNELDELLEDFMNSLPVSAAEMASNYS